MNWRAFKFCLYVESESSINRGDMSGNTGKIDPGLGHLWRSWVIVDTLRLISEECAADTDKWKAMPLRENQDPVYRPSITLEGWWWEPCQCLSLKWGEGGWDGKEKKNKGSGWSLEEEMSKLCTRKKEKPERRERTQSSSIPASPVLSCLLNCLSRVFSPCLASGGYCLTAVSNQTLSISKLKAGQPA